MRIPVFARRANPRVDRPIQRKSLSYARQEVEAGRADWIYSDDPSKGIICRELLYFGEKAMPVETIDLASAFRSDGELRGIKVVPAASDPASKVLNLQNLARKFRPGWDWNFEQAAG